MLLTYFSRFKFHNLVLILTRVKSILSTSVITLSLNERKMNRTKEADKEEEGEKREQGWQADARTESNAIKVRQVGRNICIWPGQSHKATDSHSFPFPLFYFINKQFMSIA